MRDIYKLMLILSAVAMCDGSHAFWKKDPAKEAEKQRIQEEKEKKAQQEAETLKLSKNDDISTISNTEYIENKKGQTNMFTCLDWTCNLQTITKKHIAYIKTCPHVKRIKITSSTLENISEDAFYDLSKLEEIDLSGCSKLNMIGPKAFRNCTMLYNIQLPESLKRIGNNAFSYCNSISEIHIPKSLEHIGVEAFSGCKKLQLIDLSNCLSLGKIDDRAFLNCQALTKAILNCMAIGANVFSGCTELKTVDFAMCNKLIGIGNGAFSEYSSNNGNKSAACSNVAEIDLSTCKDLQYIAEGAFKGCRSLKKVAIGSPMCAIGNNAFSGCNLLNDVTFFGLKEIGDSAFYRTGLIGIDLSNCSTLTKIGKSAFKECVELKAVNLNRELQSIGDEAFYGCTELEGIKMSKLAKLDTIGESAFYGCKKLKTVNISECWILKSIKKDTFKDCESLTTVSFNKVMESIEDGAFAGCSRLNINVHFESSGILNRFPDTLVKIGDGAFDGCRSLTLDRIYINSSDGSIGNNAFNDCVSLKLTELNASKIGKEAFQNSGIEQLKINVGEIGDACFAKCSKLNKATVVREAKFGESCFKDCKNLCRVEFDYDLTSIAKSMFDGCESLEVVCYYPYGNLFDSSNLKTIESKIGIPRNLRMFYGVNNIGDSAFKGCKKLAFLPLKYSEYLKIGDEAFSGCEKITMLATSGISSAAPVEIGKYAFNGCTKLNVLSLFKSKTIGKNAFSGCESFSKFVLDDQHISDVSEIGEGAFSGSKIESINLNNDKVTAIRASAFQNCTELQSTILSNKVESIGDNAYDGCTGLKAILLPATVTKIGKESFKNCKSLKSLTIPANIEEIGKDALLGCDNLEQIIFSAKSFSVVKKHIQQLKKLKDIIVVGCNQEFPESSIIEQMSLKHVLTRLNTYKQNVYPFDGGELKINMLSAASDFESIQLKGDNLKKIGPMAFYGMSKLKSIEFPKNVEFIDNDAFKGCDSLSEIIVPEAAYDVKNKAFEGFKKSGTSHFIHKKLILRK